MQTCLDDFRINPWLPASASGIGGCLAAVAPAIQSLIDQLVENRSRYGAISLGKIDQHDFAATNFDGLSQELISASEQLARCAAPQTAAQAGP